MLLFTLTVHWSMGSSSFALKLQTPETAHSEGTETEGNSGRQDFFFLKAICSKQLQKPFFWKSHTMFACWENTKICILLIRFIEHVLQKVKKNNVSMKTLHKLCGEADLIIRLHQRDQRVVSNTAFGWVAAALW